MKKCSNNRKPPSGSAVERIVRYKPCFDVLWKIFTRQKWDFYFRGEIPISWHFGGGCLRCSSPGLFGLVIFCRQVGQNFFAVVALNQNLPILAAAPRTAKVLQLLFQLAQIGTAAHKAGHQRHHLALALLFIEPDLKLLLGRRQGFLFVLLCLVFEIGIGAENNAAFIVLLGHVLRVGSLVYVLRRKNKA